MSQNQPDIADVENDIDVIKERLSKNINKGRKRKYVRFALAALGSIPWIGGLISGAGSLQSETQKQHVNALQQQWL